MTLLNVIRRIEAVAGNQPAVGSIVRDNIFLLNERPDVRYGSFAWVQGQHSETMENDMRTYRFTFFYIDRLLQGGSNALEVQSVGMDTLGNIMRTLAEDFDVTEWSVDPFTQRFADECAGAYCSVTLRALRGGCFEEFPEGSEGGDSDDMLTTGNEIQILQ